MSVKKSVRIIMVVAATAIPLLFGCEKGENEGAGEYVPCYVFYPSASDTYYSSEMELPDDIYRLAPGMKERSSWNIEMMFYQIKNHKLEIAIIDHDNLGFAMNDDYLVLEIMTDNEWEVIYSSDKENAYNNLTYYTPRDEAFAIKSVLVLEGNPIFSGENEKYLKNGRLAGGTYRLTKMISGRPIYAEFYIKERQ